MIDDSVLAADSNKGRETPALYTFLALGIGSILPCPHPNSSEGMWSSYVNAQVSSRNSTQLVKN